MQIRRHELFLGGCILLLLATGIVRIAVPDRSRLRPISVEGLDIPDEEIASGASILRERQWQPPTDVYVLGWTYFIGAPQANPEVVLVDGNTTLFLGLKNTQFPLNPSYFQAGTGYRLAKGHPLTFRMSLKNTGPPGHTLGARALIYFIPVEGN
jgi:hypothetical protein